ncbi:MAG: ATP-binding cassette domain-containing protein [Candidatus Ancillula sp.]|jgi:putative ABC transport system ATP-binding protein|nr:ATP-binding cassette domain-containing protein [Candidatus Ancillula sp.]
MTLHAKNLTKCFDGNVILENVEFSAKSGDIIALIGESGSGKTTLLNCLGTLEKLDSGKLLYKNADITKIKDSKKTKLYRNDFSFLFQNFGLVDEWSVFENLEVGVSYKQLTKQEKRNAIYQKLKEFGLESKIKERVYKLSGGQQQRVAIIRALLKDSNVVFADEPTASLDKKNSSLIMNDLLNISKSNKTVILATHDTSILDFCNVVYEVRDKNIVLQKST